MINYNKMTVVQIKAILKRNKLPVSGCKRELIERVTSMNNRIIESDYITLHLEETTPHLLDFFSDKDLKAIANQLDIDVQHECLSKMERTKLIKNILEHEDEFDFKPTFHREIDLAEVTADDMLRVMSTRQILAAAEVVMVPADIEKYSAKGKRYLAEKIVETRMNIGI